MIYKRFEKWGHVLINHLLLVIPVIPVSLYTCVSSYVTNTHTHTHTLSHARTHTHTHSHVHAHAHARTHTHTHTCRDTHTNTHMQRHSHTYTHTHTHPCELPDSILLLVWRLSQKTWRQNIQMNTASYHWLNYSLPNFTAPAQISVEVRFRL